MTRRDVLLKRELKREMGSTEPLLEEEIERLEENKKLKKKNKELKETKERLEKKIKTAISYFESEEFKKSCKVLTEKLDNTGEYGYWLIVREYIDCVKERLK